MKRFAVVVDPYADARGFSEAFQARDCETVAVLSSPEPLECFADRWSPELFFAAHFFDGDFQALLATLRSYDPACIIPGNEFAVELAAMLADALLPGSGNSPRSALAHRDKGRMALALERAGLPHLRTVSSSDPEAVALWIERAGLTGKPMVLKPPKSAGAEDVYLVPPGGDWMPYFDRILGKVNKFGFRNETVIVQEYAEGTEYIVDLYSVGGRHGLVDVCRYVKHQRDDRIGIYDAAVFMPPADPDVLAAAAYVCRAADAVGIRNGSTHAEVMLTADGPRLIEIAGRLAGAGMMASALLATGDNQSHRTIRHVLDGCFTPGYDLRQQVRVIWLGTQAAGILRNIEVMEAALELPSVHSMSVMPNGQFVAPTVDVYTELGWIIQAHPDEKIVEIDYQRIKEMERQVIVVAPE